MCGICGKFSIDSDTEIAHAELEAMCRTLQHRGPEDYGIYQHGPVGIGATRLAFIDLEGGHQPMHNEDRTVWGAQNGEIYNFRELLDDLISKGHEFGSYCDTEVVIHLYEEYGDSFVDRLQGMYAIAIWDGRRRRFLLARDRLGIKPLFYAEHDGTLVFGSEIKALLVTDIPRRVDPVALHDYLSFDYVPGPRTMFDGIRKLPAGHMLVSENGTTSIRRYWDIPPRTMNLGTSIPELAEQVKPLLLDAVRDSMVSDVPVGAFLSGGLDSSLVVALMSQHTSERVRTFSVGFREQSYNELPYAKIVAEQYGTDHHEVIIEPQIHDVIHSLVDAFDEPFADSSAIAAYYVSKVAAQNVKAVLSGDGGDEIFGGYAIYQADRMANLYRRLPRVLGEQLIPNMVNRLPASDRKVSWDLRLRRFVEHARLEPLAAHGSWRFIFTERMKEQLYAEDGMRHDSLDLLRDYWNAYQRNDILNRFMYVDTKISLVDDMLTKVDRTSMAHSLEVRVPLLDYRLVEMMAQVPSSAKVHGLTLKYLLKHIAREYLPKEIVDRRKAGFQVPVPVWIKNELRPLIAEQLGESTLKRQGLFDPAYVQRLIQDHQNGRNDYSRNIWGLLMFSLWYDRYIERVPAS